MFDGKNVNFPNIFYLICQGAAIEAPLSFSAFVVYSAMPSSSLDSWHMPEASETWIFYAEAGRKSLPD